MQLYQLCSQTVWESNCFVEKRVKTFKNKLDASFITRRLYFLSCTGTLCKQFEEITLAWACAQWEFSFNNDLNINKLVPIVCAMLLPEMKAHDWNQTEGQRVLTARQMQKQRFVSTLHAFYLFICLKENHKIIASFYFLSTVPLLQNFLSFFFFFCFIFFFPVLRKGSIHEVYVNLKTFNALHVFCTCIWITKCCQLLSTKWYNYVLSVSSSILLGKVFC